MLCESSYNKLEPKLELNSQWEIRKQEATKPSQFTIANDLAVFGAVPTAKVLCRCGAIAEMDRTILSTKRSLGKTVECRRCRTNRIAREKEELDKEYFGIQEDE